MGINPKIFKAYDIRGKYPSEINEKAVEEISTALAKHFLRVAGYGLRPNVVIGHDARLSSPALYEAVLRAFSVQRSAVSERENKNALNANRCTLYPAGIITTPMLYFLVNKLKAAGGIMVTASHNPKEYNGLKVVGKNAEPMSGVEIRKIVIDG